MNNIFAPDISPNAKPRAPKLAERLVERIESEVVQSGLPIGTNLGFEPDLIAKYGVSRSVLREAISILERGGLLEMRRGRYGGLTVAASPQDSAVNMLQNYLSFVDYLNETRLDELLLVRGYLEPIALRKAARRADDDDVKQLRSLEAEVRAGGSNQLVNARLILRSLFNTCRNPAAIVLIRVLNQLSVIIGLFQNIPREQLEQYGREILKLRLPQIEALIAGDLHELTTLQFRQIDLLRRLHERHRSISQDAAPATLDNMRVLVERLYEFTGIDRAARQSDVVAQFILYELWRNNWPQGHHLGFEPDLVNWIGTTKATFREALRVLERMGVVTMATGRSGGLAVSTPDPHATLSSTKLCLRALGVTPAQTVELYQALALAALSELIDNPRADRERAAPALRQLLQQSAAGTRAWDQEFRLCLAAHCGNRIVALFTQLLADLFPLEPGDKPADHRAIETERYRQIVAAMEQGDAALARRQMIRIQLALASAPI